MNVLEIIDSFSTDNPSAPFAQMRDEMLQAAGLYTTAGEPDAVEQFRYRYKEASDIVFPASSAYLKLCHALDENFTSFSLSLTELDKLRALDLEANQYMVLNNYGNDENVSRPCGISINFCTHARSRNLH